MSYRVLVLLSALVPLAFSQTCSDYVFLNESRTDDTNPLGYYRVTMYRYDQPQYESGTTCYTVNVADLQNRMIEVNTEPLQDGNRVCFRFDGGASICDGYSCGNSPGTSVQVTFQCRETDACGDLDSYQTYVRIAVSESSTNTNTEDYCMDRSIDDRPSSLNSVTPPPNVGNPTQETPTGSFHVLLPFFFLILSMISLALQLLL